MEPRVSFVTLVVRDLAATRRFYVDGLGWQPVFEDGEEVVMVRVADRLILAFWTREGFAAETGQQVADGVPPVALAHNVIDRRAVDDVLAQARGAGAEVLSGQERAWGGYSGYFTDPDGITLEFACWTKEFGAADTGTVPRTAADRTVPAS